MWCDLCTRWSRNKQTLVRQRQNSPMLPLEIASSIYYLMFPLDTHASHAPAVIAVSRTANVNVDADTDSPSVAKHPAALHVRNENRIRILFMFTRFNYMSIHMRISSIKSEFSMVLVMFGHTYSHEIHLSLWQLPNKFIPFSGRGDVILAVCN